MTKYRYSWTATGMKKDPEGSWVLQSADEHHPDCHALRLPPGECTCRKANAHEPNDDPGCPCHGRDIPGCKENCPGQQALKSNLAHEEGVGCVHCGVPYATPHKADCPVSIGFR